MDLSQRRPITDQELAEMLQGMDQAEQDGIFDGLFCREQPVIKYQASKEQLIQSIGPTMNLTKGFFLRIYGYEISWPGFADQAIKALEDAGCSRARTYYVEIIGDYQRQQDEAIKPVAAWYAEKLDNEWKNGQKEGEEERKQKEQIIKGLERMSDGDLLKLWQQRK